MVAYDAVAQHVAGEALTPAAAVREIYLGPWPDLAGTDPFVHVAQPVAV